MQPHSDPFREARNADGTMVHEFDSEKVRMILRHEDVRKCAKDWRTFSSNYPFRVPIPSEENLRTMRQIPLEVDPPEHEEYRDILEPIFRRVKDPCMVARVEALFDKLLTEALKCESVDAVYDLAILGPSLFTPNRLMPSAGMFGSLPTGVMADVPWQTLLFRPAALTVASHPGLNTPPDYLLLDLFNMPVVEPYAITEPLSTAGRVNMNYQILPFTYIKRSTAVLATLHTERMTVLTTNAPTSYGMILKFLGTGPPINVTNRPTLNLSTNNGTLRGFEDRFTSGDIFRSAAEICSIPLVPANSTWSSVTNTNSMGFWATNSATGDNSKERPYARIYPKLTTKSNTYTVHYRVEVLKKSPNSTTQDTWADGTDKVLSTYRGSTTIERYVNPRDPGLPDYASTNTLPPIGPNALPNFYKFRILGERQFNP